MKKILTILIFFSLISCIISCEKNDDDGDKNDNFYQSDYRIGLWISPDKRDTLDFIDNTNLIRKGDFYEYEEYLYRVAGKNLFISLPNSSQETHHPILTVDANNVVLGNMYITNGFTDNSGVFIKEIKE